MICITAGSMVKRKSADPIKPGPVNWKRYRGKVQIYLYDLQLFYFGNVHGPISNWKHSPIPL